MCRAHNAAVTCTLFAPVPELVFEAVERGREAAGRLREKEGVDPVGDKEPLTGYAVISGDYDGDIKVFIKEGKVGKTNTNMLLARKTSFVWRLLQFSNCKSRTLP